MITPYFQSWLTRAWHSFTVWMREPIDFPGMTYTQFGTRE